ncbi:hypothetical protein [Rhizobium phaseoli]|uniref:Large polyvalent protein-associated domain-containing protein n=1 Tax=Rhizobium phaseoli TaxID=396 RepID=A0ABM6CFK3_9HYPH|nr:hypothetical protein [Rhizobium phaseoli]ANL87072.1 hypothetical protein AMC81_PA00049 [Rhizobium phaseoli]ANL93581.1 hypothetical protein AMC80_PA00049 [Rhizobium phaseoli]
MKSAKEIAEFAYENLGTSERVRAMSKEQIVSILRELTPEHSITKRFEDDSTKSYSVKDGMLREIAFDSERNVSWNVYAADTPDNLVDSMGWQRSGKATHPSTFSLMERFEMGEDRPPEVTPAHWQEIMDDYTHYMVMENTDDEFIPGTSAYQRANYGDDHAYDDYGDQEDTFSGPEVSKELWEEAANSLWMQESASDDEPVFGDDEVIFRLELGYITCTSLADGETSIWEGESYARVSDETFAAMKAEAELRAEQGAGDEASPSNNAFDLTSMMAATAKPIDDGRTVPDGPTGTTSAAPIPAAQTATTPSAAPAFRKGPDFSAAPKQADGQTDAKSDAPSFRKGPDFSTAPAPKKKPEDEKLTSQTPIIQLNDYATKPKLATDEIARRGAGVAVARKAYRVDGKEITSSYEFTTGGKVLHTGFDGKKTEMTFEQAKRHEIAEIDQLNRNAIAAINMMATDPKFSLRQGDATYSVKNGFFIRQADDGSVKKERLEDTRKRFSDRGHEINAMQPERTAKPAATMQTVQPKAEKSQHFARMADRAEAAAVADTTKGKNLDTGHQLGA